MSTETDRLDERGASIEGNLGQMNDRVGTIEGALSGSTTGSTGPDGSAEAGDE